MSPFVFSSFRVKAKSCSEPLETKTHDTCKHRRFYGIAQVTLYPKKTSFKSLAITSCSWWRGGVVVRFEVGVGLCNTVLFPQTSNFAPHQIDLESRLRQT